MEAEAAPNAFLLQRGDRGGKQLAILEEVQYYPYLSELEQAILLRGSAYPVGVLCQHGNGDRRTVIGRGLGQRTFPATGRGQSAPCLRLFPSNVDGSSFPTGSDVAVLMYTVSLLSLKCHWHNTPRGPAATTSST